MLETLKKPLVLEKLPRPRRTPTYSQPDEYRYCLDSIILPMFVADELAASGRTIDTAFTALDVCAGCGVVGLELAQHLPALTRIDFLEVQSAYRVHFNRNVERVERANSGRTLQFLEQNYEALSTPEFAGRYDLIVGNPPYFLAHETLPAKTELRNRSRSFRDGTLESLLLGTVQSLKPGGCAYLLIKSGVAHGRTMKDDLQFQVERDFEISVCAEIRGTQVLRLAVV